MSTSRNLRMIDVGNKAVTARQATARGSIVMKPDTFAKLAGGTLPKGDALAAAKLAGIMAAKKTPDLIPMCHPLLIENLEIDFNLDAASSTVQITAVARGSGKTGFEMEAMTAVSVAALTIYDMCKMYDSSIRIESIRLSRKSGGKSGNVVLE